MVSAGFLLAAVSLAAQASLATAAGLAPRAEAQQGQCCNSGKADKQCAEGLTCLTKKFVEKKLEKLPAKKEGWEDAWETCQEENSKHTFTNPWNGICCLPVVGGNGFYECNPSE